MHLLYKGPSELNGDPIVALLTGEATPSANVKTGPMLQTWILHDLFKPTEALSTGLDAAVCGQCPLRNGACYVNVGQAPNAIWKAYNNGNYTTGHLQDVGNNRQIRLGAYGDPAAVPGHIWSELTKTASGWTGYTHQPSHPLCQVSVESRDQALRAQLAGSKTFRVKLPEDPLLQGEILCPSHKGLQCADCMLCDGQTKNIAVNLHGAKWKQDRWKQL